MRSSHHLPLPGGWGWGRTGQRPKEGRTVCGIYFTLQFQASFFHCYLTTKVTFSHLEIPCRKLIVFKMFVANLFPLLLLIYGIWNVYQLRANNYTCGIGNKEPDERPDEGYWYGFLCLLMITYALELLVWPAIVLNHIIRLFRRQSFWVRNIVGGNGGGAERFEQYVAMGLRLLQCTTCNKTNFRNQGELKEFACHFVSS